MRVGIPIDDLTAAISCAFGVMLALYERKTTGVGRFVHTSLLEAQVFMLDFRPAAT
jgi:formyl-CoA transferase